jgi:hypothetical protein
MLIMKVVYTLVLKRRGNPARLSHTVLLRYLQRVLRVLLLS